MDSRDGVSPAPLDGLADSPAAGGPTLAGRPAAGGATPADPAGSRPAPAATSGTSTPGATGTPGATTATLPAADSPASPASAAGPAASAGAPAGAPASASSPAAPLTGRRIGPVPPPTIYDVASAAGVSIASVSRVLNGRGNPLPETKERVLQAVAELGFIPDGAARALSARLKEVIGVVIRRPTGSGAADSTAEGGVFQDEAESLQFPDLINRGIEVAAQHRDYNLLVSSVDVDDHDHTRRINTLARKSDGLILHDQVIDAAQLERLSRQVPIVTLAGVATPTTSNVGGDNQSGMRDLAVHLVREHGYQTIAYLGGHPDSPDNLARHAALRAAVADAGGTLVDGPQWQGDYCAAGGAQVIGRLLAGAGELPQAIACANDQSALGVVYALMQHGLDVPGDVAVTGFDDIPMARHLRPQLTTVRQPIQEIGATAFEVLYSMISNAEPTQRDIMLPTRLITRESCGCRPDPATPTWRLG